MDDNLLRSYLNDHLAAATAEVELAGRARDGASDPTLRAFLEQLEPELAEERDAIQQVMGRLDVKPDRFKMAGAWVGEKVGRLKLNGQITGTSPLSRLVELEGLTLTAMARLALWQSLAQLQDGEERIGASDPASRVSRAEDHLRRLEQERRRIAEPVFARTLG